MAAHKPRAALSAFLGDAVVVWKPRRLSRPSKVVLALAAAYAAIDVAAALTLPRLLWADSGWPLLHPRWVWHPYEAALYVADGKFLVLYEAPAVGDPAGYYYMPLGPVLFSVPAAIGDLFGSVGALLVMMVGWGAFWAAGAVALGAYRLAGFTGAVVASGSRQGGDVRLGQPRSADRGAACCWASAPPRRGSEERGPVLRC